MCFEFFFFLNYIFLATFKKLYWKLNLQLLTVWIFLQLRPIYIGLEYLYWVIAELGLFRKLGRHSRPVQYVSGLVSSINYQILPALPSRLRVVTTFECGRHRIEIPFLEQKASSGIFSQKFNETWASNLFLWSLSKNQWLSYRALSLHQRLTTRSLSTPASTLTWPLSSPTSTPFPISKVIASHIYPHFFLVLFTPNLNWYCVCSRFRSWNFNPRFVIALIELGIQCSNP